MWAVLLGLAFRAADKMTKKVLADVADGISMVVTWIINLAPFGIFGNAAKFGSRCSGTRKDFFLPQD